MSKIQNLILSNLPSADLEALRPHLDFVQLAVRTTLIHPDKPIEHVTFLETGLGSEIAVGEATHQIEVGIIGKEGIIGLPVVLGQSTSPHRTFMQIGGSGLQISVAAFEQAVKESDALRTSLLRYTNAFMLQVAQTALANGRYQIQPRLARWLLMTQDRMGSESLPITHEFLGLMLGVRRAGVTEALGALEKKGLVKGGGKASIVILDRDGLAELASGIYG